MPSRLPGGLGLTGLWFWQQSKEGWFIPINGDDMGQSYFLWPLFFPDTSIDLSRSLFGGLPKLCVWKYSHDGLCAAFLSHNTN